MKKILWSFTLILGTGASLLILAAISGCETTGDKTTAETGSSSPQGMAPPFGGPQDMQRAESLWRQMRNYRNWNSYPGLDGWQPGKSPHGKVLRYYINRTAARNPERPGDGSIIIKENYGRQGGPLMAVTVMQKIAGYDPEDQDWFWVKYDKDGNVMKNPKGMNLAGRVAKGMPKGCIACHSNAGGGDFLFIND